jgi:hypothetical protein
LVLKGERWLLCAAWYILGLAFKEVSMARAFRQGTIFLFLICLAIGPAFSEDAAASGGTQFGMGIGIGVQSFNELDATGAPVTITYQSIGFTPDLAFGKFGIGLAVTLNYRFTGDGNSFEVRTADWVPSTVTFGSIIGLYLPKISYVRWGLPGDPLFIKLGSFDDGTLGDGFIMGDYNNALFLPEERHFGLQAGVDGNLFNFPYVGIQTLVGNLAVFDVIGVRVYARPLVSTTIPILKDLETGLTFAADTDPYFNTASATAVEAGTLTDATSVSAFGMDVRVPIVSVENVVSLIAYTDAASLQGTSWGGMIGVGGRLINIFTYGLQLRFLGENFIPDYFGATYDLYRDAQYQIVTSGTIYSQSMVGWLASFGTSFLEDKIVAKASIDGPFGAPTPTTEAEKILYCPHLRGIVSLAEGIVPGISFDFSYDKKAIMTWADLVSAQNAAIQAQLNFKSGPAVISLVYKIVYDPTTTEGWVVTSGLQSSIELF